jgi:hypothetical protein
VKNHRNRQSTRTRNANITSIRGVERPPTFPAIVGAVVVVAAVVSNVVELVEVVVEFSNNVVLDEDVEAEGIVVELARTGTA